MKHKHHRIPKYRGGTDDASNIIEVTVEEHANLHLALYLEDGRWQDWIAYHGLMKMLSKEECIKTSQRESMIEGWKNGRYKYTDVWRKNVSEANKRRGATIYCIELAKHWKCAKDAGEELSMNWKSIYDAASGKKHGRHTYNKLTFYRVGKVEFRPQFTQPKSP